MPAVIIIPLVNHPFFIYALSLKMIKIDGNMLEL